MENLEKNELNIIRTIFSQETPTRPSLSQGTRLSLVKVSTLLSSLEKREYIHKDVKARQGIGRPSFEYKLSPKLGVAIGISVGLDSFRILGMDSSKTNRFNRAYEIRLPLNPEEHVDFIIQEVFLALEKTLDTLVKGESVICIGMALPGMVDTRRGIWLQGLQLTGITHINMAGIFKDRFHIPVF
ncbi:MAG TPA: hypothetical protein VMX75_00870, partial [Spirochaetia bacterium]|nr:hypothetical protein [Spirochaetia bacterium]